MQPVSMAHAQLTSIGLGITSIFMVPSIDQVERVFSGSIDVDAALDVALGVVRGIGFDCVIYDYTPVPLSHDGRLITPSVLKLRNTPSDMEDLWRNHGYYQIDPVQDAALTVSRPFVWSYDGCQSAVMERVLRPRHSPVVSYLRDTRLTTGVTVPIGLVGGDLATFTVIGIDPEPDFVDVALHHLPEIGDLGHLFHDLVFPSFDDSLRTCLYIRLTERERQCLNLCAEGLTTKQIAHRIGRSIPTVTFHLGSATRKLGARNRSQAIARAAHYRLLDDAAEPRRGAAHL